MAWEQQVIHALNDAGMRITGPRRTIVAHIANSNDPLTAEQLVEALPIVGRATVYRTLEVLTATHWVARIHRDDGEHAYLPAQPHKHQLVCTNCGKTLLFDTCDLDGALMELGQRTGFLIEGHSLEAFGICANCQAHP